MDFGDPQRLVWLWLLAPLAWLLRTLYRRRRRAMATLIDAGLWTQLAPGWRPEQLARRLAVWWLAVALLLLALARPQWGVHWQEVKRRGLDILILLDTSKSMLAEDIKPNRLTQAKFGIQDLLRDLRGDRIGLVAFAGASFLQCPLTIDYAAFRLSLDDVNVGIIPRGGTALADALRTALRSFEAGGEADRAIILITDGEDHEGDPARLVDELKKKNVRVFAIGVGSLEGELIPVVDAQGRAGFLKDADGQVVKTRLAEGPLRQLALGTGGAYVRAAPGDLGLDRILRDHLATLKRSEGESRLSQVREERFMWFLGAALALLAMESAWGAGRRRIGEESP